MASELTLDVTDGERRTRGVVALTGLAGPADRQLTAAIKELTQFDGVEAPLCQYASDYWKGCGLPDSLRQLRYDALHRLCYRMDATNLHMITQLIDAT